MKHFLIAISFFSFVAFANAQTCGQSLTLKASSTSGLFKVAIVNNNFAKNNSSGNFGTSEIESLGWTSNANGYPIWTQRTLFQYDVSTIPKNATISSAKLYLYAKTVGLANGNRIDPTFGTANTSLLQRALGPWDMNNVGWASQPTVTQQNQKVLAQSTSLHQNYVLDMQDFVQLWVNRPDSNYGVLLRLQTEATYNSMIFYSFNDPDSVKARLEICYTIPLPVHKLSFSGNVNNGIASLNWYNSDGDAAATIVEKSVDGVNFQAVGSLAAAQASTYQYHFTNTISSASLSVYYRLKIVGKTGSITYSESIVLATTKMSGTIKLFPNPTSGYLQLSVAASKDQAVTIKITDLLGRAIVSEARYLQKGNNTITLNNLTALSRGNYNLSLLVDGNMQVSKLVIQK
ncbi:DNRLRE domain-containing protein [Parasediminibacterium sp. JCM 36343]|uniref:DNRLRE domain-containing protein n=1 Tax=Parasediminibacterium sp. JCM 36343 TaxID=3374279 RepID=UPI0039792891